MLMKFEKYADNKFMATNAAVELDIEVVADGFGVYFVLSSAFDKYQFESFEKAVACYHSAAYQEAKSYREEWAKAEIIIVEGVTPM